MEQHVPGYGGIQSIFLGGGSVVGPSGIFGRDAEQVGRRRGCLMCR